MRARRVRASSGRPNASIRWIGAIFVATFLGGVGALAIATHNSELRRIIESIFRPTNYSDFADVNARPQLGRSFNQPLSQRRVMRIEGPLAERHMRGMAFETYVSNGAWAPAMESRGREDAGMELKAHSGGQRITVTPLIDNLNVLFVPLHMEGVDAKSYRLLWSRDWDGPIYASSNLNAFPPYEVAVVNETFKGPLCLAGGEKVRERCLDTIDIDPRVVALAKQIAPMSASPDEKIEAVRKYLWRNHSYSLTIDLGPGDPVTSFLLQKRDGHCQYFASSAVLLLRCLGVPARYVTGYYAHESPEPDVTVVRQRDAHAWVETWSDGMGWNTFDPTPSGGMPGQSGGVSFWARQWERLGDWAEAFGAWLRESPATKLTLLVGIVIVLGIVIHWLRV